MKKILSLLLALTLLLSLSACDSSLNTVRPDPGSWKYSVRGVDVMMHDDAAPVLDALGESISCTEEESSDFSGPVKTYFYGGFFLQTYPMGGREYIYSLWLADDSSATAEGICIGSGRDEVEAAYGTDCFDGSTTYTMTGTTSTLTIILESDTVAAIRYDAVMK